MSNLESINFSFVSDRELFLELKKDTMYASIYNLQYFFLYYDSANPCSSEPCKFNGKCEEKDSGFRCECDSFRYGTYCEKGKFIYQELIFLKTITKSIFTIFLLFSTYILLTTPNIYCWRSY